MSAEASGYVTALVECPDGAALSCSQKAVLWCLADHHNRSYRVCWPSHALLMRESRLSKDSVQRALAYCEQHGIIRTIRPANQGRGALTGYQFVTLDETPVPANGRAPSRKGEHCAPLFSVTERGAEGEQTAPKRGAEGEHTPVCNKEEPGTKREPRTKGGRAHARESALSQSERDTLDLKRWRQEMANRDPHVGQYIADPEAFWRRNAREAAYHAGISPARLLELLAQFFPDDDELPKIFPNLRDTTTPKKASPA